MKAITTWAFILVALLLLALLLRAVPTSLQGLAILAGVLLTNLGLMVYIVRR